MNFVERAALCSTRASLRIYAAQTNDEYFLWWEETRVRLPEFESQDLDCALGEGLGPSIKLFGQLADFNIQKWMVLRDWVG